MRSVTKGRLLDFWRRSPAEATLISLPKGGIAMLLIAISTVLIPSRDVVGRNRVQRRTEAENFILVERHEILERTDDEAEPKEKPKIRNFWKKNW